jgi:hypothetical protein
MHIQGLLDRQGSKIKTIHLAEVLTSGWTETPQRDAPAETLSTLNR